MKAGDSQDVTESHLIAQLPGDLGARIHTIRGVQVMLDSDLAKLYGVESKVLNQAVKRNLERFPPEFCFQVTEEEQEALRSQSVILEVEPQCVDHPLRSQIATLNPGEEGNGSLRSQSVTLKPESPELLRFQFGTLNAPGRGRHRKFKDLGKKWFAFSRFEKGVVEMLGRLPGL